MPDLQLVRGTPWWWLEELSSRLDKRRPDLATADAYFEGNHPLAFASERFRRAFGGLFEEFADNWCELVVDAVEERLNVEGFRFGADQAADRDAWRIWQANQLDAQSLLGHTEALVCGTASVLVQPGRDPATPEITVEHPSQMIVATAPGQPQRRLAALKRWAEDDGVEFATLYLPHAIYKFRTRRSNEPAPPSAMRPEDRSRWVPREVRGEAWPLPNPLGAVSVVPLPNRPRLLKPGRSEIAQVIPVQNAVNKLLTDLIVMAELGALPARWASGFELDEDPETNQPRPPQFVIDLLTKWVIGEDQGSQFGQFPQPDLTGIIKAIELVVQHLASRTRTPPHYFYLSGQFPSGESIKSAETGLVAKVRRKMIFFGEAWEEVLRLAFAITGDMAKASIVEVETIWGDPESRTEGEHIDAVGKKRTMLELPREMAWEDAGLSPVQIERAKRLHTIESAMGKAFDLSTLLDRPNAGAA